MAARGRGAARRRTAVDNAVVQAGPLADGVPEHGPFDAMLVEGAIEVLPERARRPAEARRADRGDLRRRQPAARRGSGSATPTGIAWRRIFDATAPVLPGFAATKAFEF